MENFTDKLREIRDKFHPDKVRKIKSLRDVKSPRLRKLIFGLCILLSLLFTAQFFLNQEEANQAEFRDTFVKKELKGTKVANWNVVKNFAYKDGKAGIYTYQTEKGFYTLIYDLSHQKVLFNELTDTSATDTGNVSNSATILGAQLLLKLFEEGTDKITELKKIDDGFRINGKDYKLENQYSRLTKVNGKEVKKYYNIHFTSPAARRLLKKNGIDTSKLLIGRVQLEDKSVIVTAREDGTKTVLVMKSEMNSKVTLSQSTNTLKNKDKGE